MVNIETPTSNQTSDVGTLQEERTALKPIERRIDYALVMGLGSAFALITAALIFGGSLPSFYNVPAIFIVLLGTVAVTMISFNLGDLCGAAIECLKMFFPKPHNMRYARQQVINLALLSKDHGILALDKLDSTLKNEPFLQRAVALVVDGNEENLLDRTLTREIYEINQNRQQSVLIIRRAAEVAPSMGLIGTLVGLIQLLGNLDSPSQIGPAMAVALLTTFYGAVLAYMIFAPVAAKLETDITRETAVNEIYKAGVISISKQEHIHFLETYLNTKVPGRL